MKVEVLGRVTTFGAVAQGALLRIVLGQIERLGMKVWIGDQYAFLTLAPGLVEGTAPGILSGSHAITILDVGLRRNRPANLPCSCSSAQSPSSRAGGFTAGCTEHRCPLASPADDRRTTYSPARCKLHRWARQQRLRATLLSRWRASGADDLILLNGHVFRQ